LSVKKGDTIKIHYRGLLDNGEEFDSSFDRDPIEFKVGDGQVIDAIDHGVVGLQPGERREISVGPADGYGERRDDLVRKVPKDLLGGQQVVPGEAVEIQTQDGQILIAEVTDIDEQSVTFDLNHPLAGRDLEFQIELVDIIQKAA
jgi:peptidylprolyl isomerase